MTENEMGKSGESRSLNFFNLHDGDSKRCPGKQRLRNNFEHFFKFKNNCFMMLCRFLPYNNINHKYAYIASLPPPTPFYPSRLSQSIWGGLPVLFNNFPLVIYFTNGNVYVSIWAYF